MNNTKEIYEQLKWLYQFNRTKTSGHKVQNGDQYVEIRNALFVADNDFIINAPEYDELKDGKWYVNNYEFRMKWQLPIVTDKLTKDCDTRQAIISLYNHDELENDDMICTMYVSLRLDRLENDYVLTYTVNMRSSDVREFRSDLKFHTYMRHQIATILSEKMNVSVLENPIIWYADSLQCWDKDFQYLKV